jgi:tetratricopeptide (TPR) repeat protein
MIDASNAARRDRAPDGETEARDAETLLRRARRDRGAGKDAEAVRQLRDAVRIRPDHPALHVELAGALMALGRLDEAAASVDAAAALAPGQIDLWMTLGMIRYAQSDRGGALEAFGRAVECDPHHPQASNNLGLVLLEQGRLQAAADAFLRAIDANPGYAIACNNLGKVFDQAGDWAAAETWFNEAVARNGAYAEARHNLAASQLKRGAWRPAIETLGALLGAVPGDRRALWNMSDALLRLGDFAAGWRLYEHGIGHGEYRGPARPRTVLPYAPDARRLLLWGEQGLGEEIMFASMMPELSARGASGVVECDPRLMPLFARSLPGWRFVPATTPPAPETAGPFDAALPLASLAQHLRPAIARFPRHAGYLRADRARGAALRARYAGGSPGPVVGISWMSGARLDAAAKSTDLRDWAPVLALGGVRFVSLQFGNVDAQVAAARRDFGADILVDPEIDQLRDADAAAAQVAAMDHVVTVSNTTAHLAGALGRPGMVLLPAARGLRWHWMTDRPDSPWYPSLTLLRQSEQGRWDDVLAAAAARLAEGRIHP